MGVALSTSTDFLLHRRALVFLQHHPRSHRLFRRYLFLFIVEGLTAMRMR